MGQLKFEDARNEKESSNVMKYSMPLWILFALFAVFIAHVALIPAGNWTADEYKLLATVQNDWTDYLGRVFGWSPRPFSEAILVFYRKFVQDFHRPLLTPFLVLIWALLLSAPLSASLLSGNKIAKWREAIAVTLLLITLCLMSAKPGEAFYWPAGAAAYIPSLAAVLYCSVAASEMGGWSRLSSAPLALRIGLLTWLLIGATSSEIGAAFVIMIGTTSILFSIGRKLSRTLWIMLPPTVVAVGVLLTFNQYRGVGSDAILPDSPTRHHLIGSILASLPNYIEDITQGERLHHGFWAAVSCIAIRALLLQGLRPLASERCSLLNTDVKNLREHVLDIVLPVATLGAGFASLVSAYLKFGTVCCERHETLRQALIVVTIFNLAALWPIRDSEKFAKSSRIWCLSLPIIFLIAARFPGVVHDFRIMPDIIAARSYTWRSGLSKTDNMTYLVGPAPRVAGGVWPAPAGHYVLQPDGSINAAAHGDELLAQMKFFGKRSLEVR